MNHPKKAVDLKAQVALQSLQIAQLNAQLQAINGNPTARIAAAPKLYEPTEAELQAWYAQVEDTAPRLTKNGWLVHPRQGFNLALGS